jgi:hypothetical protein
MKKNQLYPLKKEKKTPLCKKEKKTIQTFKKNIKQKQNQNAPNHNR